MQDKRKLEGEIFKENCLTKYDGRTELDSALSSKIRRRFRTPRKNWKAEMLDIGEVSDTLGSILHACSSWLRRRHRRSVSRYHSSRFCARICIWSRFRCNNFWIIGKIVSAQTVRGRPTRRTPSGGLTLGKMIVRLKQTQTVRVIYGAAETMS